jgi:hypothetical protein
MNEWGKVFSRRSKTEGRGVDWDELYKFVRAERKTEGMACLHTLKTGLTAHSLALREPRKIAVGWRSGAEKEAEGLRHGALLELRKIVEKEIERNDATVSGEDEIRAGVRWRLAGNAGYPSNPADIT